MKLTANIIEIILFGFGYFFLHQPREVEKIGKTSVATGNGIYLNYNSPVFIFQIDSHKIDSCSIPPTVYRLNRWTGFIDMCEVDTSTMRNPNSFVGAELTCKGK